MALLNDRCFPKEARLALDTPSAKRLRIVFGYVGFIKTSNSDGTASPLHARVFLKLPFRYGETKAEVADSFLYARANAIASKSALNSSFQVLSIGSVVRGLIEKARSDYDTAQLAGDWDPL